MKIPLLLLCLIALGTPLIAQEAEQVTLRFLSFPKSANPQPVELLLSEGETLTVKIPTNALSAPYKVKRLTTWAVGKTEPAANEEKTTSFTSYGSAPALASSDQLILLIRNGKENRDGMQMIVMDNSAKQFGGGQFFLMNAAEVDIAGMLGGTKFSLKPGKHKIIEPKEMIQREGGEANQFFTEFFFRKKTEARPFFSSTWPANKKARSMVFFYHDTHNKRLRMHTIRDYIP